MTHQEDPIPLLLLRGWMRDARHWEEFPAQLQAGLDRAGLPVSVECWDLPGNGPRCGEITPDRIEYMAARLSEERPLVPHLVVGLSMGGMIGAEWARSCPHWVKGLILINSSMRPFAHPWERLRPGVWPEVLRHAWGDASRREPLIARLTLAHEHRTGPRLQQWQDWAENHPVSLKNTLRQLKAAASYRYRGRAPTCPVHVLVGEADQLVNPVCSKRLADAWHVPIARHPSGGHDLPLDASEWTRDQVVRACQTMLGSGDGREAVA